jgi:cellulose synthase (UDP-forming)
MTTSGAIAPVTPAAPEARSARSTDDQDRHRRGDRFPTRPTVWAVRASGVLLLGTIALYVPWMLSSLDRRHTWLGVIFAGASLFVVLCNVTSVVHTWWQRVPTPRWVRVGAEPHVAVIIPTYGEPVPMVVRTVRSVLDQDWPADRLTVVVSDDGHDPVLREALADLPVRYHEPPERGAPERQGDAKAGNLNAALALLDEVAPHVRYVETRDADDEVGNESFLRLTLGHLEVDPRLAYVQTVKDATVSGGDPFNNRHPMFYGGQMLARNAANAVFPCGSGLVWRRTALEDIGRFPTWNLVEDLQSGVEALRRGWRGIYLPIVGAVAQHAPEDLPNVYKQRGTWAIDTVRLMLWGDLRGLNGRQRWFFTSLMLHYLEAFAVLVFLPVLALTLLGVPPLVASGTEYLLFALPYAIACELFLYCCNLPFNDRRRRQRAPWRAYWRFRVMATGMAPVYVRASLQAVLGGPHRKPVYRVTRKHHEIAWHWRHAVPQLLLVAVVPLAAVISATRGTLPDAGTLVASGYWGALYGALMASFVARSWHGLPHPLRAVAGRAAWQPREVSAPTSGHGR